MKTYIHTFFISLFTLLAGSSIAYATVGGPTYVGSFTYSHDSESVYYTQITEGGRGCPPELKTISLDTGKIGTSFSCDQGESLATGDYQETLTKVTNEISKLTKDQKPLMPLSLPLNKISVDVSFVREEFAEGDPSMRIKSYFLAEVYQNERKIDEFEITGCSKDQPFTFAGYSIPGFEKKIILLSSTKGDCWEGGYTREQLHVVGGPLATLDTRFSTSEVKTLNAPLVPSESTLVVFEKDGKSTPTAPIATTSGQETSSSVKIILIIIAALVVGMVFGKLFTRKQ
jgi:uncharacterized membrane protein